MQSGCNPLETVARTDVQDTPEDFSNWEFFLAQDADLRRCVESDSRTTMPSDMSQPCQPQPPPAQAVHASPVIGSRNRQAPTGLPPSGKSRLKAAQNRQAQQRLCAQQKVRQPFIAHLYSLPCRNFTHTVLLWDRGSQRQAGCRHAYQPWKLI